MILDITEEDEEETPEIIDPEVQKQRIRQIIEYQKSICMAYSLSSSVASCSLLPSSQKGKGLLELIEGRRFSLGRLFEMDLWDNDSEDKFHDPWMFITQIGPTKDLEPHENRKTTMTTNRKLSRTKSFGRLPRSGCCRCRGFWFKLKSRQLQIMVCGRKF